MYIFLLFIKVPSGYFTLKHVAPYFQLPQVQLQCMLWLQCKQGAHMPAHHSCYNTRDRTVIVSTICTNRCGIIIIFINRWGYRANAYTSIYYEIRFTHSNTPVCIPVFSLNQYRCFAAIENCHHGFVCKNEQWALPSIGWIWNI